MPHKDTPVCRPGRPTCPRTQGKELCPRGPAEHRTRRVPKCQQREAGGPQPTRLGFCLSRYLGGVASNDGRRSLPPAADVLLGLGPTLAAPVPPVLPSHGRLTPKASWPLWPGCGRPWGWVVSLPGICPTGHGRTGARGRREPCAEHLLCTSSPRRCHSRH